MVMWSCVTPVRNHHRPHRLHPTNAAPPATTNTHARPAAATLPRRLGCPSPPPTPLPCHSNPDPAAATTSPVRCHDPPDQTRGEIEDPSSGAAVIHGDWRWRDFLFVYWLHIISGVRGRGGVLERTASKLPTTAAVMPSDCLPTWPRLCCAWFALPPCDCLPTLPRRHSSPSVRGEQRG
jgi:hypothetical protein